MNRLLSSLPALAALSLLCLSCGADHAHDDDGLGPAHTHVHQGPHGGTVLEVGEHVAHLELLHDDDAGTMTIHVLKPDVETPWPIAKAPSIVLLGGEVPTRIASVAVDPAASESAVFVATDAALKSHELEGRVTVEIDGKTYNPALKHGHGH